MATINEDVNVRINAEDNASKKIEKVNGSIFDLKKGLSLLAGAFTVTKTLQFADECIKAYEESIRVSLALEVAAKNAIDLGDGYEKASGGVKKATDELQAYATSLQSTLAFEDDAIVAAESVFLQFGAGVEQVKLLTPAMLDLAASIELTTGTQVELTDIAHLMGKTFDGSVGILERYKIQLNETQKAEFENATELERMGLVAQYVSQQYAGSATEMSNTTQGELRKAEIAWGNYKEQIGAQLLPIKAKIGEFTAWFVSTFFTNMQEILRHWDDLWVGFFTKYNAFKESFAPAWTEFWQNGFGATVINVANLIVDALELIISTARKVIDTLTEVVTLGFATTQTYNPGGGLSGKSAQQVTKAVTKAVSGKKAAGGNVSAGESYLVGEKGMEVFTPKTNGFIWPNNSLGNQTVLNFNFNGTVSSREVAEEYADMVVDKLKLVTKVV
jgi:hypothetical protein